jgi:hypothetical protein
MSQDWIRQIEDDNRRLRDEAVKTGSSMKELEERLGVANEALELVDDEIRPMINRMAFIYGDPGAVRVANELTPLLDRWRSYLRREESHV